MTLGEKIEILISNNGWNQAEFADKIYVSPSTVSKWIDSTNTPRLDMLKEFCKLFAVTMDELTDDAIEIPEYYVIDHYIPYSRLHVPEQRQDSVHTIIDAALAGNARLHRFTNHGGEECSTIYQYGNEIWWHYRVFEPYMIREWNKEYGS